MGVLSWLELWNSLNCSRWCITDIGSILLGIIYINNKIKMENWNKKSKSWWEGVREIDCTVLVLIANFYFSKQFEIWYIYVWIREQNVTFWIIKTIAQLQQKHFAFHPFISNLTHPPKNTNWPSLSVEGTGCVYPWEKKF